MIYHYLLVAFRNLRKNAPYSLVKIIGLTIGLSVSLTLLKYSWEQFQFDSFHTNGDQIYLLSDYDTDEEGFVGYTSNGFAKTVKEQLAHTPDVCRLYKNKIWTSRDENQFHSDIAFVDKNFFSMLDFPLIAGSQTQVFTDNQSIVISEAMAASFFGEDDPINQIITVNLNHNFTVSGVFKELPKNSSLKFDAVIPISNLDTMTYKGAENGWHDWGMTLFLQIPELDEARIIEVLKQTFKDHAPAAWQDEEHEYKLIALSDVHLNPKMFSWTFETTSELTLGFLSLMAVIILIIAFFNAGSISFSVYQLRLKEIGIRRVIGVNRKQLKTQFSLEGLLEGLLTSLLSMVIVFTLYPIVANILQLDHISLKLTDLSILLVAGISVGWASHYFPVWWTLSKLTYSIKFKNLKPARFQSRLFTIQYIISIFLILAVVIIYKQTSYIQQKNLGYVYDGVISMPIDFSLVSSVSPKANLFKEVLLQESEVKSISLHQAAMGSYVKNLFEVAPEGKEDVPCRVTYVDPDYFSLYNIDFMEGVGFQAHNSKNQVGIILNHEAAQRFGWAPESAIGKMVKVEGQNRRVKGVVENFHLNSLYEVMQPIVFLPVKRSYHIEYISVKINSSDIGAFVETLRAKWNDIYEGIPFHYEFVDDKIKNIYADEYRLKNLFLLFSIVSILLSSVGIFVMAVLTMRLQLKEIAIRKIHGATLPGNIFKISQEYIKWVIVAFIIAAPLGWFVMGQWLDSFAYKTELSWWIFVLAGSIALGIALLTVSWQSWKAATRNPVEVLRYE